MKQFIADIIDGAIFAAIIGAVVAVFAFLAPDQASAECEAQRAAIAGEVR